MPPSTAVQAMSGVGVFPQPTEGSQKPVKHSPGSGQVTGRPPPQTPLWQRVPSVQALPSSQATPAHRGSAQSPVTAAGVSRISVTEPSTNAACRSSLSDTGKPSQDADAYPRATSVRVPVRVPLG